MYSPRGNKLKYLKYIRLRLQDHHRSFKHASVYRINRIQNVFFFFHFGPTKKRVGVKYPLHNIIN